MIITGSTMNVPVTAALAPLGCFITGPAPYLVNFGGPFTPAPNPTALPPGRDTAPAAYAGTTPGAPLNRQQRRALAAGGR